MITPATDRRREKRGTLLAITSEPPWPLDSGGHLRTFNLLDALAAHFDVHLICPASENRITSSGLPQDSACTIECVTVPDRTLLGEAGRVVSAQLSGQPYSMYRRHDWPALRRRWTNALDERKPQYVWLDHIDSFQYCPDMTGMQFRTILDMHNVYSLILSRLADECTNPLKRFALMSEARRMTRMERLACRSVDVVVAVSNREAEHFAGLGAKHVCVAPNGVNAVGVPEHSPRPSAADSPVILFLGAMSWQPNISAAIHLARTVLPAVKARYPGVRLNLVGKDPVEPVRELANLAGVTVTGTVPDIEPYLSEATVMVVPLESGGGTRLKILESFAVGLPVVSTPVGIEGIDAENGVHLRVAELDDFPEAIFSVFDNLADRRMTDNARNLVRSTYEWSTIAGNTADFLHRLA